MNSIDLWQKTKRHAQVPNRKANIVAEVDRNNAVLKELDNMPSPSQRTAQRPAQPTFKVPTKPASAIKEEDKENAARKTQTQRFGKDPGPPLPNVVGRPKDPKDPHSSINFYKTGELLGVGGFAPVYQCKDPATGTCYALKVVRPKEPRSLKIEDKVCSMNEDGCA